MAGIYLSLLGLYSWDPEILDGMTVPSGINRDALKTKLLAETAELELLYQDPDLMKELIRTWAITMQQPWERMMLAFSTEYNPLHNYDRTEEWTDETERTGQEAETRTGQTAGTTGSTRTSKVGGWAPGSGIVDRDQETISGTSAASSNDSANRSRNENENNVRRGRAYGNIGVTTSMQMLIEEVEGRNRLNMYDLIVEDFKSRFCLLVY